MVFGFMPQAAARLIIVSICVITSYSIHYTKLYDTYRNYTTSTASCYAPIPKGELQYFFVRAYDNDTGGYGPYSAAPVLGFSSNVTVIYDDGESADALRAEAIRAILEDDQGITGLANIYGSMPAWTVTLLPEDLIATTYSDGARIYGDPIIVITSYSIHYTKLYDIWLPASMSDGCVPLRAHALQFWSTR